RSILSNPVISFISLGSPSCQSVYPVHLCHPISTTNIANLTISSILARTTRLANGSILAIPSFPTIRSAQSIHSIYSISPIPVSKVITSSKLSRHALSNRTSHPSQSSCQLDHPFNPDHWINSSISA
ncbi:hypothetical protein V8G54_027751, partial [Vigna mungo]